MVAEVCRIPFGLAMANPLPKQSSSGDEKTFRHGGASAYSVTSDQCRAWQGKLESFRDGMGCPKEPNRIDTKMKYNLIVAEPGKEAVPYELNADRVGLGRGPENQIHVPSEFVSHTHIEFHLVDGDIELQDLGSKNGTRVNGVNVEGKVKLRDGDRILIGECIGAHLLMLPDDADPVEAATKGDAAKQKAATTYATLDQKIQDLETEVESKQSEADALGEKIIALSKQHEARKAEFDKLEGSVAELKDQLESKREAAGENATQEAVAEIQAIEKDILKQTQKITVLKTDLDKREAEISELQSTAKVKVAAPTAPTAPPSGDPAPPPPAKPAGTGATPPPATPPTPTVKPVAPPPAKPATPGAPPAPPAVGSEGAKPPSAPTADPDKPSAPRKPLPIPKRPDS